MSIHPSKIYEQRTTKLLHHLPSAATMVLRNLVERSMLHPALAAIWAINTFPSAKAKAMIHRRARMLATLRQLTIAGTQQLMAASCHAYVSNVTFLKLDRHNSPVLIFCRSSSTSMFFLRMQSHKVSTVPCTVRPGDPRTVQTTASTVDLTVTPCQNPTATPRARK